MVDAMLISSFFYLVLLSFSLASIQLFHPTHGLFCFILCYLSWVYTFSIMFIPHCKYFFLSSCTRNMAHNAVNTRSQSLLHRKYMCTRPVRQMPFGVTSLKNCQSSEAKSFPQWDSNPGPSGRQSNALTHSATAPHLNHNPNRNLTLT